MKKFLSATVAAVMALSAIAAVPRATIEEARTAIEEGRAAKSLFKKQTKSRNALISPAGNAYVSPLTANNAKKAKAPARVTAGGSNIYGYLGYTSYDDTPIGLYTIEADGYSLKWADPMYEEEGFVLSAGWFDGSKLCGFAPVEFFGYITDLYYFEYEFETGNVVTDRQANMDRGMFSSATYNPDDKCIYGYGEDNYEGIAFLKASAEKPDEFECVKVIVDTPEEACSAIAFNVSDHKLYGVNLGGSFVSIASDGTQTEVMKLAAFDEVPEFIGGLVYSPVEDVFFYNYITDYSSDLYKIDINKKTVEFVKLYGSTTFPILFTTDEGIDPEAPAMPETVKFNFTNGANSGTIVYALPTSNENGDKLEGNLTWTALLDDSEHKSGSAAPGSEVSVEYANLADGMHVFAFYVSDGTNKSRMNSMRQFIGFDTPAAPTNVKLTDKELSWTSVTSGANGGYVNTAEIEYEAFLNGQSIGKTKATSIAVTIPDAALSTYEASVVAICSGKTSAPATSNTIIAGKPFTPDVNFAPTASEAQLFTIIDVGNDENTWEFDPDIYGSPAFKAYYDPYKPMDDWLFLPPVALNDPEKYYTFSMNARRLGSYYEDDYFEIHIGTSPEPAAMTTVLIPKTKPDYHSEWDDWGEPYSKIFKVAEAGTYYIGIRCVSDEYQYGLLVRNISVLDENISAESPVAVDDAVATAAENGVLEASVSFTLPTKTIAGTDIPAGTELTATVSGNTIATVKGKPGEKVTAKVSTVQGENTIKIVVSDGESKGLAANVGVFTGVHIPGVVTNLAGSLSDDMLSFTLTWDAPAESEDGGYFDPATVSYAFYTYDGTWGWQKAKDLGTARTYTFTIPAGSEQDLYRMGIATSNSAGEGSRVTGITSIMGTPYTLPMGEDFEGDSNDPFQINPWTYYTPTDEYDGQLWSIEKLAMVSDRWSDLTTSALVGSNKNDTGKGKMAMPRFTSAGATDIELELLAWVGEDAATITITGTAVGMNKEVTVGTIPSGNGWKKNFITLPAEFNGKGWVQLYIEPEFKGPKDLCVVESLKVTGKTSGIGNITAAQGSVRGGKGTISVSGFDSGEIAVFTIDGKTIATGTASQGEQTFAATPGLYIVKVGDKSFKVIVK